MSEIDTNLDHLYPEFRTHVVNMLHEMDTDFHSGKIEHRYRINEGFRTMTRQLELYAQGRTAPGPRVTQLRVGFHNTSLACDIVAIDATDRIIWDNDAYEHIGYYAHRRNLEWGGDWHGFVDLPHVQPVHADCVRLLPIAIEWAKSVGLYPEKIYPKPSQFHI